jgi:hypothetical protein
MEDIKEKTADEIKILEENYNNLVKVSRETAFDDMNNDTEMLCRVLLKQGHIELNEEKHEYVNPAKDDEFQVYGIMYTKEKIFLLDDDKLDDYTRQLEEKNKEQGNIINTANIAIKDLQWKFQDMKEKVEQIRDKAECMDYYCLKDIIDDLNKLLGDE